MGDVTMAIISCTCVFMAVFIPVTFTEDEKHIEESEEDASEEETPSDNSED